MAKSARKLNFMIDNDVADELDKLVPQGSRSKLVSRAIARELALQRRRNITERLEELRTHTPPISGSTLLSALKSDRERA